MRSDHNAAGSRVITPGMLRIVRAAAAAPFKLAVPRVPPGARLNERAHNRLMRSLDPAGGFVYVQPWNWWTRSRLNRATAGGSVGSAPAGIEFPEEPFTPVSSAHEMQSWRMQGLLATPAVPVVRSASQRSLSSSGAVVQRSAAVQPTTAENVSLSLPLVRPGAPVLPRAGSAGVLRTSTPTLATSVARKPDLRTTRASEPIDTDSPGALGHDHSERGLIHRQAESTSAAEDDSSADVPSSSSIVQRERQPQTEQFSSPYSSATTVQRNTTAVDAAPTLLRGDEEAAGRRGEGSAHAQIEETGMPEVPTALVHQLPQPSASGGSSGPGRVHRDFAESSAISPDDRATQVTSERSPDLARATATSELTSVSGSDGAVTLPAAAATTLPVHRNSPDAAGTPGSTVAADPPQAAPISPSSKGGDHQGRSVHADSATLVQPASENRSAATPVHLRDEPGGRTASSANAGGQASVQRSQDPSETPTPVARQANASVPATVPEVAARQAIAEQGTPITSPVQDANSDGIPSLTSDIARLGPTASPDTTVHRHSDAQTPAQWDRSESAEVVRHGSESSVPSVGKVHREYVNDASAARVESPRNTGGTDIAPLASAPATASSTSTPAGHLSALNVAHSGDQAQKASAELVTQRAVESTRATASEIPVHLQSGPSNSATQRVEAEHTPELATHSEVNRVTAATTPEVSSQDAQVADPSIQPNIARHSEMRPQEPSHETSLPTAVHRQHTDGVAVRDHGLPADVQPPVRTFQGRPIMRRAITGTAHSPTPAQAPPSSMPLASGSEAIIHSASTYPNANLPSVASGSNLQGEPLQPLGSISQVHRSFDAVAPNESSTIRHRDDYAGERHTETRVPMQLAADQVSNAAAHLAPALTHPASDERLSNTAATEQSPIAAHRSTDTSDNTPDPTHRITARRPLGEQDTVTHVPAQLAADQVTPAAAHLASRATYQPSAERLSSPAETEQSPVVAHRATDTNHHGPDQTHRTTDFTSAARRIARSLSVAESHAGSSNETRNTVVQQPLTHAITSPGATSPAPNATSVRSGTQHSVRSAAESTRVVDLARTITGSAPSVTARPISLRAAKAALAAERPAASTTQSVSRAALPSGTETVQTPATVEHSWPQPNPVPVDLEIRRQEISNTEPSLSAEVAVPQRVFLQPPVQKAPNPYDPFAAAQYAAAVQSAGGWPGAPMSVHRAPIGGNVGSYSGAGPGGYGGAAQSMATAYSGTSSQSTVDVPALADQVYAMITRRILNDSERRGRR